MFTALRDIFVNAKVSYMQNDSCARVNIYFNHTHIQAYMYTHAHSKPFKHEKTLCATQYVSFGLTDVILLNH